MKLLLGGVPLGCDNIGDEAIIACVVRLLRELISNVDITVCTQDQENTARQLAVETAPLFGFHPNPRLQDFRSFVRGFDAFIWFGATGLSDYPDTALALLATAQEAGVKTIVWGVGMDDEFTPAFFTAQGKKKALLNLLSFGHFNALEHYEAHLRQRIRQRIHDTLEKCSLIAVRDPESAVELNKCGLDNIIVAADTAILQTTASIPPLPVIPGIHRIGFCISAQREITQKRHLLALWSRLLALPDTRLVLIPMNPKTDKALMCGIASELPSQDRVEVLESDASATVQACAAQCSVVVSSRLHLLILASNVHVPVIGIERGSKIRNWLNNFNDTSAGTVANCDFEAIYQRILTILSKPDAHLSTHIEAQMGLLHARLMSAAQFLKATLLEIVHPDEKPTIIEKPSEEQA